MTGLDRSFVYFPDPSLLATPASRGLRYEDARFMAADGVALHGWLVSGGGRATWIWFHGNAGNISFRLELMAKLIAVLGVDIFVFDYRGYGLSAGRPSEKGTRLDARAALAYLRDRGDVDMSRLVYYGVSLGGAVATELAVQHPPAALILDAPMPGIIPMARSRVGWLAVATSVLMCARYDTLHQIASVSAPVLVMHGDQDEVIPFRLGRAVYEAAAAPKRWFPIPGASHNDTYIVAGQTYFDALRDFLDEYVPTPAVS